MMETPITKSTDATMNSVIAIATPFLVYKFPAVDRCARLTFFLRYIFILKVYIKVYRFFATRPTRDRSRPETLRHASRPACHATTVDRGNTHGHVGDSRPRASRQQDLGLEMRQMTDRQMIAVFGIVMVVVGILIIGAGLFGGITVSLLIFGSIPTIVGTLALARR